MLIQVRRNTVLHGHTLPAPDAGKSDRNQLADLLKKANVNIENLSINMNPEFKKADEYLEGVFVDAEVKQLPVSKDENKEA